jgi:hypothetical protein
MPDAEEALTLARDAGNPQRLAETLVALGRLLQWRGDFIRGMALLHEGATLARQFHAGFLFGQAAFFLGNASAATGMYADAWQWYQQLRAYANTAGDRYWMARVPNTIGGLYLELFDLDAALQKSYSRSTKPAPACSHRQRARRDGVFCPLTCRGFTDRR